MQEGAPVIYLHNFLIFGSLSLIIRAFLLTSKGLFSEEKYYKMTRSFPSMVGLFSFVCLFYGLLYFPIFKRGDRKVRFFIIVFHLQHYGSRMFSFSSPHMYIVSSLGVLHAIINFYRTIIYFNLSSYSIQ